MLYAFDIRYLAGIFDADGSFSIVRHTRRDYSRGFDLRVLLQLTWRESAEARSVMEEVRARYGGGVTSHGARGRTRPTVRFTIASRKAVVLATDLEPHLRLKWRQAQLCMRMGELVCLDWRLHPGEATFRRTADEVWTERERLAAQCVALNAGGAR